MSVPVGSGSLVVPLVLWGRRCPSHTITALATSPDQKILLSGSSEGQLCVWHTDVIAQQIEPKLMFYGHTGSITSIAATGFDRFVSADDNGELCLWDTQDDQCLESKKLGLVHLSMQAHRFEGKASTSLLCNGNYPELHIINSDSLEIIYSLVARVHPDWVNAFCMLKPLKRKDDIILAVTNSGTIKMWTINIQTVNSLHVYEDESKQIRCVDAKMIRCCPYNQRTVLIVCSRYWQIYDAGEFSLLCSENAFKNTHWEGGNFIAIDKVIVWNSDGKAYIYKLPTNSNPEHGDYHHFVGTTALQHASPVLICTVVSDTNKILPTPSVFLCKRIENELKYVLLRADSDSSIHYWTVKAELTTRKDQSLPNICSSLSASLTDLWHKAKPIGILDRVQTSLSGDDFDKITCSLYIESSARLISGLNDGNIVIVPILHTIRSLLFSQTSKKANMAMYRVLKGHKARVNCLLYPHSMESRYNPNHLLSGSADFNVCLWDLSSGQLIHTFTVHAGEVTSFYIPPPNCNRAILSCICSVARDHSVALLNLKEKRSLMFASRHMFPVSTIKWRAAEDFMVISCTDSTAYIWQMETGLLDRVVHGVTAVEILKGCDETAHRVITDSSANASQISIGQALKRRNLAAFKNLAQQTIQGIENLVDDNEIDDTVEEEDSMLYTKDSILSSGKQPLIVQSLKSRTPDADAHVLFFDTERLILQLLCDEFGLSSLHQAQPSSRSSQKQQGRELEQKFTDFISMVKDKAEGMSQPGNVTKTPTHQQRDLAASNPGRDNESTDKQYTFPMEVAQTLLSLIHAWTIDNDLDILCVKKLGLERLDQPVSFGLLSGNGHAAFMLPKLTHVDRKVDHVATSTNTRYWEVSRALTTQHLLAMISLTNTLMSMVNATFIKPRTVSGKKHQPVDADSGLKQSEIKQGWSLLATLHCILLPERVNDSKYKSPRLHLLANRWQDRCLEVREAAQALLLAELRRIESAGRRKLINEWAPYMPILIDDANGSICLAQPEYELVTDNGDEPRFRRVNCEKRRLEATAIIMLGLIGAEFGSDIECNANSSSSLAWHTSKALSYLLLNPVECKLPPNAPLRRAAIDLLGRGFSVWQPYIDVSAILLGLLELCVDADKIIPGNVHTGLPLSAAADACRTARHALSLIATAQPATFLTCMAKEVARYNAAAQNTQSGAQLHSTVLIKAKSEILRVIETLIDKLPNDVADLLLETMDVAVHCLDPNSIKQNGLRDTFPALCKFPMVSYCSHSRRICVGSKNGTMGFYEIKQSKAQSIPFQASPTAAMIFYLKASSKETITAHQGAVAAVCFSEDGKYLASYSPVDFKVHFWQTSSSSLFGSQHTKCIKSYSVPWKSPGAEKSSARAGVRFTWSDHRTVTLTLPDGTESRYRV